MGHLLAQLVWKQRYLLSEGPLLDDFLGLGLIGIVYGISLLLDAWGFLAVFATAISLRHSERKLAGIHASSSDIDAASDVPVRAEELVPTHSTQVSEGSLLFKESLERLSELMLVLLLGGMLFLDSWSLRAVGLALFLFIIVRPVSVFLGLLGSGTPLRLQMLVRRTRHRLSLLLDVRDRLWPAGSAGSRVHPHYASGYRALNHYPRANRQTDNVQMVVIGRERSLACLCQRELF
jgi:NhaP-type Na+/H+ or K+/H+ antiporter